MRLWRKQTCQKGKYATKTNIVLKKAEVLRPKKGRQRSHEWKENKRNLDEVGEAPLKDDQKKPLCGQHLAYQHHGTLAEERSHEK